MRTGRPLAELVLSEDQRGALRKLGSSPKDCASFGVESENHSGLCRGEGEQVVARQVRLTQQTVSKWRSRFVSKGLEDCWMNPVLGRLARSAMQEVEKALVTTLESLPRDATHWSTRSLAATMSG